MPFQIVRNDITAMQVDAIVNTANPRPVIGAGSDALVHRKAGPALLEARQAIGVIRPGCAAITPGFDLPARYVIHTVGPVWRGGVFGEAKTLRSCFDSSLKLAAEYHCQSVAFPLISTGNYGFPPEKALQIAMAAIREFLLEQEMTVYLVVFNREAFRLSEKLFRDVTSFIDEHYVLETQRIEYGMAPPEESVRRRQEQDTAASDICQAPRILREESSAAYTAPKQAIPQQKPRRPRAPVPKMSLSLRDLLQRTDAGFSETLLKLIDQSGKKDSEIYNRANVSRQHFSKIRNNPHYKPTKPTAIAFAIALELDLEQTRDLIGRAGYALTRSSKFDLIIMYFISQGNYNLYDINAALFEFDQSLLGA